MKPRAKHTQTLPPPVAWSSRLTILSTLAIALFSCLLYVPSLRNAFVWDDIILIGSPEITTLDAPTMKRIFTTNFWDVSDATSGMYRPLSTLSFYADYQMHKAKPAGFHQTNIILNAAVSGVTFLALLEMFAQPVLALVAALLFTVSPIHVENVAWVSGRTDIIATLFALLTIWFYARWRNRGGVMNAAASLVAFVLALLSKEIAVVVPAVIAVYELSPRAAVKPEEKTARPWSVLIAMCVLLAAYFAVRRALLGSSLGALPRMTHGFSQAVAFSLSVIAHYAYKLVFPFRLNPTPEFPPPANFFNLHTLVGIAVVGLIVVSVIRWKQHRAFMFGMAVIVCGLLPVLHIVPANQVLAERFLYFPSFGYALLVALAMTYLMQRRKSAAMVAVGIFLLACSVRTVTGTVVWKDEMTLFGKAVQLSPNSPTANFDFGVTLAQQGKLEDALVYLRRATEISPNYADAWSAMGRAEDKLGQHAAGLEHCARAVQIAPDEVRFLNDLGTMQFQAQKYADSAESFRRLLELRPRHTYARFNLGLALYQQRDFPGAIRELNELPNKDEDFPVAWFFLAESLLRTGSHVEAANAARRFLSVHAADDEMAARAKEIAGGK
jgi:tetratricopeptide (TPR) repeat protein